MSCGHYEAYRCSRCRKCYQCHHTLITETVEWACPDGYQKPAVPDIGQWASRRQ